MVNSPLFRRVFGPMVMLALASCAPDDGSAADAEDEWGADQIVGVNSVGRRMAVEGFVYVPVTATQSTIVAAVASQMRVLFGAARTADIGLSERQPIINTASFRADTVTVVDTARPTAPTRTLKRVRYTYRTRAVVPRALENASTVPSVTLFPTTYAARASEVMTRCHGRDAQTVSPGSIWYHFHPTLPACAEGVEAERQRITADRRALTTPDRQITESEAGRLYLPLVMQLTALEGNANASPEYHRLFDHERFVAYSFFGLDREDDPYDYGAKNYFTWLRTVTRAQTSLRLTVPDGTDLFRVQAGGRDVPNVTLDRVLGWMLDDANYPADVTDRRAFRLQLLRQWRGHYVHLGMSATVTAQGRARTVPIELRTWYGDEERDIAGAVRLYTTAFREADVFQYTGHSHLGYGPLDPQNYAASVFPNKYQLMMVNSCVSFNYYNQFFRLHPGGSANLDTVTNGIEVYLEGAGLSSARFMLAMLDGRFRNYRDVLTEMRVDLPWEPAHDPNRVADGERDNQFTTARVPMSFAPLR
jgi:hypothetical protein